MDVGRLSPITLLQTEHCYTVAPVSSPKPSTTHERTARKAPQRRTAQPADTRTEILAAALAILADEGHTALTMRRVATQAGCSTIGVYTWFGGKDGLVNAILVDGFESFAEALRSARRRRGPIGALLAQGFAYRAWALAHPTYYQVMFMQAVPGHVLSEPAATAGLLAFEILRTEVQRLQATGAIAQRDCDAIAMTVWGTAHGLVSIEIAQVEPHHDSDDASLHERSFQLAMTLLARALAL